MVSHLISMYSASLRSTFLRVLKLLQVKEARCNFWGEPILQKVWIIWSPHLYFNFKNFVDRNSLSFIRFQRILHDSGALFSAYQNFYNLKRGHLISRENQFCTKSELFGSPLLYLNFNSFVHPNSSSLIRLQCILHDSGVLFKKSWNFYKLKRGGPNF